MTLSITLYPTYHSLGQAMQFNTFFKFNEICIRCARQPIMCVLHENTLRKVYAIALGLCWVDSTSKL